MSEPRYLSRLVLRRDDPRVATLAPALQMKRGGSAGSRGDRLFAGHHLMWSLFAAKGREDGPRDFLWREESEGSYLVLSKRRPDGKHFLFEREQCKRFEPVLSAGDKLHFVLRANPVTPGIVGRGESGGLVYQRKRSVTAPREGQKARARSRSLEWLERHAERNGFSLQPGVVDAGRPEPTQIRRRGQRAPIRFVIVDFEGILRVEDPDRFVWALGKGFGAMKSFGCGLMLVRRSRL